MSGGWHRITGIQNDDEYLLNDEELRALINVCDSFDIFITKFFSNAASTHNKEFWAEKTPSNAFTLENFYNIFPNAKFIHIVRNPYDTIASLVNRGKSPIDATITYLMNTSAVLNSDLSNLHTIKYEDLVSNPQSVITKLLEFLNLKWEDDILNPSSNETGVNKMKGWNYAETDAIGKSSINKFKSLNPELQEQIRYYVNVLQLSSSLEYHTIQDICKTLAYNYESMTVNPSKARKELLILAMKRTFSRSNYSIFNFPVKAKSHHA